MEESHSRGCGICFVDEGKSIRGQIDSCDHYFCFVCIMEWAKIESKCPLCKRRFSSIRRPPKEGVFLQERLLFVPKRDQIYGRFGNAASGPSDPYAHVRCSVCQGTTDESHLLLCDLCDTASHTYCAGMGKTVPEGDWFCHDCTVLKDVHNNSEIENDTETVGDGDGVDSQSQGIVSRSEHKDAKTVSEIINGVGSQSVIENSGSNCNSVDLPRNVEEMPKAEADFALFEIVSSIPRPRESLFRFWSSRPVPPRRVIVLDNANSLNGRTEKNIADNSTELGARTLQRCRDVQGRIQAIRENWSALQNSSLRFSSISVESGAKRRKSHNVNQASQDRPGQPCPSTSGSGQHLRFQNGSSCDAYDVEKAWKIMKTAKSMLKKSERASRVCQSSKNHIIQVNASKQATNTISSLYKAEKQRPGIRSVMSDCRNQITAMPLEACERLQSVAFSSNGTRHMENDKCGASTSGANRQVGSCSINLTRSVPGTSYSHNGKPDVCTSFSKTVTPEGNCIAESKTRKYEHEKSEIQSLVKLNLKLLSRDNRLEYDAFKKVARLATHTILAACGLEHSKSGNRFHPNSTVCSHVEDIEQLCKSTLMPDSCRECFYAFVKNVVSSIMFEKVDHGTGGIC